MSPLVEVFRDAATGTFTHIVHAGAGSGAAIIDPVLDFDLNTARSSTESADRVLAFVAEHRLQVQWVLETHAHADHLSAGAYLRDRLGATLGIGRGIVDVQRHWAPVFGLGSDFVADGSQFDRLFDDGDNFEIGALRACVLATPGHTSDGVSYLVGDAAFIGDTLFAPDSGSARCDFPGGNAQTLYASIQRLLALPPDTRLFLCHDYPPDGRGPLAETSVAAEAASNVHLLQTTNATDFVTLRQGRDATLAQPKLILPALQVNIRGGRLPPADADGRRFLRLPVNVIGGEA